MPDGGGFPPGIGGKNLTVRELLDARGPALGLKIVSGHKYLNRKIRVSEVNRPGLALDGHLENYRAERIQIIGRGEHAFCVQEEHKKLLPSLARMFSRPDTPCVVITAGLASLPVLKTACNCARIPLLHTRMETSAFVGELTAFLEDQLAPVTQLHGVLVDVYGLGVLIQGGAGIGKSECALELVKRGHILVADDIVEIQRKRGDMLTGSCPAMLKHYMEVRGLGIIDVELLFGVGSVMDHTRIEMEVRLTKLTRADGCDRTGLENRTSEILGVKIPSLAIPVTPGRNLAVLIEVASLNQRLKAQGVFAAKEFNEKLIRRMKAAARH
ncbi:MAG: HPr(Ser) kinase/phosphatase [Elusimicrobiales bacterium]|nr:HPr(Ser) kinase/phosphatase [Elusimicrobiales bacterium]